MKKALKYHQLYRYPIETQLLYECKAMAQYAYSNGLSIPGKYIEQLELDFDKLSFHKAEKNANGEPSGKEHDGKVDPPPPENNKLQIVTLNEIHSKLAQIIAPVKPRTVTIMALEEANKNHWHFLGPVPLVQRMMFTAILSLVGVFAISLTQSVDGDPQKFSLFHNYGISLLYNELFLLFSASIGASFNALFTANRYIKDSTFDPIHESSYWVRYVLGLLAGVIIATLIPIETEATSALMGFGKPILALLGGFSAQVVYRMINRLIESLDTLFKGELRDIVAAKEQMTKVQASQAVLHEKAKLAAQLSKLRESAGDNKSFQDEIAKLQTELIAPGFTEDESAK